MITVQMIRAGGGTKRFTRVNRHNKGVFTLTFNSMEELVKYCRSNCCSVYFSSDFKFTPEQQRVFRLKATSMCQKKYPSVDRRIDKTIEKRRSKYGLY